MHLKSFNDIEYSSYFKNYTDLNAHSATLAFLKIEILKEICN